jgi:hypothetical protein
MKLYKRNGKMYLAVEGQEIEIADIRDAVKALGGTVETSTYRKVELFHDYDCPNPLEGDSEVFIYHKRNREFEVGQDIEAAGGFEGVREAHPDAVIAPLYAYVHSGVCFSTKYTYPFTCQWDAGLTGCIVGPSKEAILGAIEELNHYVAGNCYGYEVQDEWGEVLDCCGGFWGYIDDELLKEYAMAHCPDPENMDVVFSDPFGREEKVEW